MLLRLVVCLVIISAINAELNASFDDRIVGGAEVSINDFPWQVSIRSLRGHFCGGSIIDFRRILTAAHCLYRSVQNDPDYAYYITVRVGSSNHTTGGTLHRVKKIFIHESYNESISINNDIAILVLQRPLLFNRRVQPILLPRQDQIIPVNTTVLISGWGTLYYGSYELPDILNAAAVQIIDQSSCNQAYAGNTTKEIISQNMLCAGVLNLGGRDSCQGDSGGPLAFVNRGSRVLYGIVSWGRKCALATHPGVYTKVSQYVKWIWAHKY